jgi:hypothetical protein
MKRTFLFLILTCLGYSAMSQVIDPVSANAGKLKISVDPRLELLCAVQSLADYPFLNRQPAYSRELMQFFRKDSAMEAVTMTTRLLKDFGFAYDAPVDLILRLTSPPRLRQTHPYPARALERAGGKLNLEKYRRALRQFASGSDFMLFWKQKIPFYQKMVEYTVAELGGRDPVGTINAWFNESKNSYTVILSPALAGGYGMRIPSTGGNEDIFACLNTDRINDGIPYYSKDGLTNYLYHEFSHSFVNPLTDKFLPLVEATYPLFEPIREEMEEMSYGRWITCINEHIVRAVHIRILQTTGQAIFAGSLLDMEKSRRFVYIDPVLNKLKKFEQERDNQKITFKQFYPELMAVFDSLAYEDNQELIDPIFSGPVQSVLGKQKVTIIYPTADSDTLVLKNIFNYTSSIQKMKGNAAILLADTAAVKADLSDAWIMAYGTVESNLFLKKYSSSFPFRITGDTLYTDRKFSGSNLRLITCLPNPQNPRRGMLVNTATQNTSLKGVQIPLKADYLVFEDVNKLLQNGFYIKSPQWEFPVNK